MKNNEDKRRVKTGKDGAILFDYDFYTIYNKEKKKVRKDLRINKRQEFLSFAKLFSRTIGKELMEREAGVSIKGLGYFYVYLMPRKMAVRFWNNKNELADGIMYHTDGRLYSYCYIPSKQFRFWSMDNTFTNEHKRELYRRLIGGQRYNGYPYTMKKLI